MSASLLQLLASGPQDKYLTVSPQITLFKSTFKRTTSFAVEPQEIQFSGAIGFGRRVTATLPRTADLLKDIKLVADLPALSQTSGTVAWTRKVGLALVNSVEISIGGSRVDRLMSQYLNIWAELSVDAAKQTGFDALIGNVPAMTTQAASIAARRVYVPLPFWLCQDTGLALSLISLQYNEVKVEVELRAVSELYVTDDGDAPSAVGDLTNAFLLCECVFLEADERKSLVAEPQEQLITQVQYAGAEAISNSNVKIRLPFNHPVKSIAWVIQPVANLASGKNRVMDFTNSGASGTAYGGGQTLTTAKITLNGSDKMSDKDALYFNQVQPLDAASRSPADGIYMYSFAVQSFGKQAYIQPSGSCNFSRIDNAVLQMSTATATNSANVHVFAINWNILRYMSGLGGVAYAS